jgi:hypothetical protein
MAEMVRAEDIFRQRLVEIISERDDLSVRTIAKKMTAAGHEISPTTVHDIGAGKRKNVTLDEAVAFAYVLGTSLGELTSPRDGETVWPTAHAGFNAEYWRYWLAYGYPVGRESEAKAAPARIAASAGMAIARIAADRLERWEAGQGRPWIPRSDLDLEVLTFRASVGTPALTVTAGVAGVAAASHAPSVPPQVPDRGSHRRPERTDTPL